MPATTDGGNWKEFPQSFTGIEYEVGKSLQDYNGIHEVSRDAGSFRLRVVTEDDFPILSTLQTVCAYHMGSLNILSAKRNERGEMVAEFRAED